jgi:ribosomal protein S18 acetylase RimI-like enzyme
MPTVNKCDSAKAVIDDFRGFPNVTERQLNDAIRLRPAVGADFPALAQLLHDLACRFITPAMAPEVASTFLRENDAAALLGYRERGHVFRVATIAGEIAGFIALRPPSHVFHLFVGERWQRRGVARALWDGARADAGPQAQFTVNSSPYAVPAYAALGFRTDGVLQVRNGVAFQPMVFAG